MDPSRTILIVDDDPDALGFASRVLGEHGYTVQKAAAWTEAIDWVHKGRPDMVLLDLHLPGIRGDALLEFIREEHDDVPVVIASSDIDGEAMEELGSLGARGFIRKPYETDDLLLVIEQVMLDLGAIPEAVTGAVQQTDTRQEATSAGPTLAGSDPGESRVVPGAGIEALTRDRGAVVQPPAGTRMRRIKKRKGSRFRTLRNYLLIGLLFVLIGLFLWVIQETFSGGFLGIGVTAD